MDKTQICVEWDHSDPEIRLMAAIQQLIDTAKSADLSAAAVSRAVEYLAMRARHAEGRDY